MHFQFNFLELSQVIAIGKFAISAIFDWDVVDQLVVFDVWTVHVLQNDI